MSRRHLAVTAALLLASAAAWACDTPVYRYAMYRWQAAPYELYFFFDGEVAETRAAAHDQVRDLPYDKRPANVALLDIDLRDKEALARMPAVIREKWEASGAETPGYLVYSPVGGQVFAGNLEPDDFKSLSDSPARQNLAKQLSDGKIGVLLMLAASEQGEGEEAEAAKKANAKTQQTVRDTVKKAALAKLYGFDDPSTPAAAAEEDADEKDADKKDADKDKQDADEKDPDDKDNSPQGEDAKPQRPDVGWLRVDRDDPQEQWLVRMLLAVEPDLSEAQFLRQPMVFVVYGRARALPPFVGRGVSMDNLMGDVEFVSGACSCTVKDQNPGVDLLVRNDWDQAADLLAAKFGSEEGNESQLGVGELFPSLALPPSSQEGEASKDKPTAEPDSGEPVVESGAGQASDGDPETEDPAAAGPDAAVAQVGDTAPHGDDPAAPASNAIRRGSATEPTHDQGHEAVARATPASNETPSALAQQIARRNLLTVGGAVVLILVVLVGITLVVLRSP